MNDKLSKTNWNRHSHRCAQRHKHISNNRDLLDRERKKDWPSTQNRISAPRPDAIYRVCCVLFSHPWKPDSLLKYERFVKKKKRCRVCYPRASREIKSNDETFETWDIFARDVFSLLSRRCWFRPSFINEKRLLRSRHDVSHFQHNIFSSLFVNVT